MKIKELEKRLRSSLHYSPAGEKSEALLLSAKAEAGRRSRTEHISFLRFLSKQIRYVGWKLWGAQGMLLLLFERILRQSFNEYFWESPQSVARVLLCLSILLSMSSLPLLYRSARYRMHEIEAAAYFSSVKLLMAKLAVIGIGDVLLLLAAFLITVVTEPLQAANALLYLCLPFLLISCSYLFMLGHCSGRHFLGGGMALGAVMLVMALGIPDRRMPLLHPNLLPVGFIACAGLTAFSAYQLCYLLCSSRYTELQIT